MIRTNLLDIYIDDVVDIYHNDQLLLSLPITRLRERWPRGELCYLFDLTDILTEEQINICKQSNFFVCHSLAFPCVFEKYGVNYQNDKIDSLLILKKEDKI